MELELGGTFTTGFKHFKIFSSSHNFLGEDCKHVFFVAIDWIGAGFFAGKPQMRHKTGIFF